MTRMSELLERAADALDDARDPFERPFLAENHVTFDECGALAAALATGARMVAWALQYPAAASASVDAAALVRMQELLARVDLGGR
jgi:hypothetical protein